uniref:Thiazole synthase n=1 Tax=Scinaia undulata TaxID=1884664 RepID=A0A1G4NXA7_9FLOR|nr:thiG protein [Scinaia undulata]SCW23292.1 thiG protein [Scinaia undulata]
MVSLDNIDQKLVVENKIFPSRLMIGTGKYRNLEVARKSIAASGTSVVTAAIRRLQSSDLLAENSLLTSLDWQSLWLLPNTAGCTSAEEAIRAAALGAEICKRIGQEDNRFVKLEVIPDYQHLFPDPIGTLKAAEYLIARKYTVLPYISPDPVLARQLEELGCAAIMPLGSPIGSGQGLKNLENINIIVDNSRIPVIVDAGIGTASDAVMAMEIGADAILTNSAIAQASTPALMADSMRLAVQSGRCAYFAGRMSKINKAAASSPLSGISA